MPKITSTQQLKPIQQSAPKKCINFVLNYSKSYHVVTLGKEKVGLTLN